MVAEAETLAMSLTVGAGADRAGADEAGADEPSPAFLQRFWLAGRTLSADIMAVSQVCGSIIDGHREGQGG